MHAGQQYAAFATLQSAPLRSADHPLFQHPGQGAALPAVRPPQPASGAAGLAAAQLQGQGLTYGHQQQRQWHSHAAVCEAQPAMHLPMVNSCPAGLPRLMPAVPYNGSWPCFLLC